MITDFIFGVVYNLFMFLVDGKEPLRFNVDSSVYEFVKDFIAFIFYILPIQGLKPIITIIVSIIVFRVTVSVIKTIWNLLPIL